VVWRAEFVLSVRSLAEFPRAFAGWNAAAELPIEPEIQEILRADDTLTASIGAVLAQKLPARERVAAVANRRH
jgi:hypothetical protein